MRFGAKLREEARPEWTSQYIDYDLLKRKIHELVALSEDPQAEEVFKAKRHVFQGILDVHLEKVGISCAITLAHFSTEICQALQTPEDSTL
jgi:SPX domain protein involved in polyphosphate accumulation